MTDEQVLEIYGFARDAFKGGQEYFMVEAFPFRMTPENMARHRDNEHFEFWKMLKAGCDQFELTKRPAKVEVCERRYVFNQVPQIENAAFRSTEACPPASLPPSLASAYSGYEKTWNQNFAKAVAKFEHDENRQLAAAQAKAEAEQERAEREAAREARIAANGGQSAPAVLSLFSTGNPLKALAAQPTPTPASQSAAPVAAETAIPADQMAEAADVPVPAANPLAPAPMANAAADSKPKKPLWKIWSSN
jgi:hypothetical protein